MVHTVANYFTTSHSLATEMTQGLHTPQVCHHQLKHEHQ